MAIVQSCQLRADFARRLSDVCPEEAPAYRALTMLDSIDQWGPEKVVCVCSASPAAALPHRHARVLVIDNTACGMGKGGTRTSGIRPDTISALPPTGPLKRGSPKRWTYARACRADRAPSAEPARSSGRARLQGVTHR